MQVARNFFLSRKRTFQRKFAELLASIHIEHSFTKEEILELYISTRSSSATGLTVSRPRRPFTMASNSKS